MKDKNLNFYIQNLASIGCAYVVNLPAKPADPEKTIIETLQFFWTKPDIFNMLIGVLSHKIHDLIHVERLISLAQDLSRQDKILLKLIGLKMEKLGDKRFKLLQTKLYTG